MRSHLTTPQSSFTVPVFCGIFVTVSISLHGAPASNLTCYHTPPVASVQELVHRSGVVVEGKLQQEGQANDMNREEREILLQERARATLNDSEAQEMDEPAKATGESLPNRTSGSETYQVRVKVHQVWEVKTGGLEKDTVVSLVWNLEENCSALKADRKYMFFLEPTNDTSVFNAVYPPVETRRSVRKDVSKVLCQGCAAPKLKPMKSVEVEDGKRSSLKCEARAGKPVPKFKWYKDGKEFSGKNKPKDVKIKKKKEGMTSELVFRKGKESHSGVYACEAINDQGRDQITANLTVIKTATSTTPSVKTSSHVMPCSEREKNYCVNGGECFTLEIKPGELKNLCRCKEDYFGDRCQDLVPSRKVINMKPEELYQKRVLTITGICIALLVVGIMCVVAYCKTKKQRKKLHDRLRQSLRTERNAMAAMANGPQMPHPPCEGVQLVNQYVSKNAAPAEHVIEKETETSFSASQYTSSAHQSTTVTHTSSQSRGNGRSESLLSNSRSQLVMSSSVENSKQATPSSRRGRLNAAGGARDANAYLKNPRETPDSYKDSPYSERYVSAMTTPNRMSPVELVSPVSPQSPPTESSPPLSSLATSVPSVAVSPLGEEERPLLFATPPRPRDKQRQDHAHSQGGQYQRDSAHYNHGQDTHSAPPSPLRIVEDDEYETTQEYEAAAAQPAKKLPNGRRAKRTKVTDHGAHKAESNSDTSSESGSSESETEDERVGEDTPFLSIQNPLAASLESASSFRSADSSRTNPGLRLSPQEDLQARLSSVIANQDPIAV
ncbi:pro-neuregulin-1, membrane-bound isoform isoform X4 [Anguilla rostrata]|uniref:pro-neuregulin-1, membrane-bound isoform isoform X4 n=1 Tax=Anguilla rostrata TaxID=7938 RepID=UPI0030D521D8